MQGSVLKIRAAIIIAAVCGAAFCQDPKLIAREEADLKKLAAFAQQRNASIFFRGVTGWGYVRNGHATYFLKPHKYLINGCETYAVSRNGEKVALSFATRPTGGCEVSIRNLLTGEEFALGEQYFIPRAWSWDDLTVLAKATKNPESALLISAVDGSIKTKYSLPLPNVPPSAQITWIDFLHQGTGIIASAVSQECQGANCRPSFAVLMMDNGIVQRLTEGAGATVSPTANTIAAFTKNSIDLYDLQSHAKAKVSPYPHPPLLWFFSEGSYGPIIWSKDGKELLFSTIIDEDGHLNLYDVNLATHQRSKLLNNTSLEILAWR